MCWTRHVSIGVARILIGGGGPKPQITCNDVIRNFQKKTLFWGKDIVEWKIRSCFLSTLYQDFGKGRGRKLIVRTCNLGDVLGKLVYSNISQTGIWGRSPIADAYGGLGTKPPAAGQFLYVFGKKSYFNPIGSPFARVHSHLKEPDF